MKLDDIKKLHQKKYRTELGCFLVEGEHLILELEKAAKNNSRLAAATVYASDSYGDVQTDFALVRISDKQMQKISDTKSPQGIVAVVPFSATTASAPADNAERTIYLHEIQDPGNLGTILRTLAWFGGFKCVLSPNSVDPYNPKVVRASMGAIFHVPVELDVPLSTLQTRFDSFACLDTAGAALSAPQFGKHQCFIFGNEARGVPREQLAGLPVESFSIQGSGILESLNLATAVNMCAYELNR
ncbi:RNA methyltransferase [uncultured Gilvimarinus sp.]|uniref:TrmH family RNA methyltransferase n=1 Tax=uncultured Gilvimarinus sp. TaxID=1689143 RepID=UPI0030ED925D|tara:strand:- start:239 stop:967 length:729 start_codon:yes stop_codon:yes gene_type:complete